MTAFSLIVSITAISCLILNTVAVSNHRSLAFAVPEHHDESAGKGKNIAAWTATATLALSLTRIPLAMAEDSTNFQQGARLFESNCALCHMNGAKTLKSAAEQKFDNLNPATLLTYLENEQPHKIMPFHSTFSDKDYQEVTSHVLDQPIDQN
jgi:mono/diheme cytochrome c family protein|uniref:Cytochrome c domain-containing protein n=1 Tax=Phaeodactylum tricornutum TaxID=2850 RepID=A0A8J9SE44_PHATR